MDASKIRGIVNEVNPPVKGKPMTLTKELSGEIAQSIPFWAPLLRNRDIRSAEGGDEYVTGLIETFSRIYSGLKAANAHGVLSKIDLETLYSLDAELSKSDMGLPDEYPALEMANVSTMGSFGAGVLVAYALLETAIAIGEGAQGQPAAGPPPSLGAPQEEPGQSLADELLAGLPEETSTPVTAPPSPPPAPSEPAAPAEPAFIRDNWKPDAARPLPVPIMTLGIYRTDTGLLVKGGLPATLSGAAEAYGLVRGIFGTDANISMSPTGLQFTIPLTTQKGGTS
jgi:hypothetical protein